MAILLLDIGNSRCKAAILEARKIRLIDSHFAADLIGFKIESVYYSSVASVDRVNRITEETGLVDLAWREVRSETDWQGLINCYQAPEKLGVDRWLAMLGARELHPQKNLLVIDAGTAITVDWVNGAGQHQGGWIIPGLRLLEKAVTTNTALVKLPNPKEIGLLTAGQSTSECLQNGCLAAAVGALQMAIQQQKVDAIVCTGGDATLLASYLRAAQPIEVDPLLIFRGIVLYLPNNEDVAKD